MGVEVQLFEVQWPPRSPDLIPLDFCLWGWMKGEVYKEKVNTRDELVARIINNAAVLKQERQDDLRRTTRFFFTLSIPLCILQYIFKMFKFVQSDTTYFSGGHLNITLC
jgi:hypothetical protein